MTLDGRGARAAGIAFAFIAGLMWGIVFVGPLILDDYPPAVLTAGRYVAFGLIALPFAWFDRADLARLGGVDWWEAVKLSLVGNFIYYICLASALQAVGNPVPSMIIGALPALIAISANLRDHRRDGRLAWRQLLPPLAVILVAIALVQRAETADVGAKLDAGTWAFGILAACGAAACWTWYPLRNADWLRTHGNRNPRVWATAQGLVTLPMGLLLYAGLWIAGAWSGDRFPWPWGAQPELFFGVMLAIGLFASYGGTWAWNQASQRLPSALAGPLIVFETLAALAYGYLYRGAAPAPLAIVGIILLILGVARAASLTPEHSEA